MALHARNASNKRSKRMFQKKIKANVASLTTTMSNDCYSLRILQDYKEMFLDKQIKIHQGIIQYLLFRVLYTWSDYIILVEWAYLSNIYGYTFVHNCYIFAHNIFLLFYSTLIF